MNRLIVLIFFLCLQSLYGCQKQSIEEYDDSASSDMQSDSIFISYLALGDSYTIGEGVGMGERYGEILCDSLRGTNIFCSSIDIVARTGWTTGDLKNGINEAPLEEVYDLVSLLIGVNNQFRGLAIDDYKRELEDLIEQAIAFADDDHQRVFVLSIPDYGVTPFGIRRDGTGRISDEIDAFNDTKKEVCAAYNVSYFDITEISRMAEDDLSLLVSDELHPSAKMYALWVDVVLDHVRAIIAE